MDLATRWKSYALLDAGDGEKLERWGDIILRRPDPQALWPRNHDARFWQQADGVYHRSASGGGHWERDPALPAQWTIEYGALRFQIAPTGFKHTGLFPEQAVNWDWMQDLVTRAQRPIRVLNLFAYTGGATVALAAAGAHVCHVDAAKKMVQRARENAALSGLAEAPIRYLVDDVMKFIQREQRRGNRYEAIVMDPPSYGRGPTGECWQLEEALADLVKRCAALLSDQPLFFLINSYTTGFSPQVAANLLLQQVKAAHGGVVTADELGLPIQDSELVLPCGTYGRWVAA